MQFHFILNGGEGPPPSEFMVIVTVSLEVRYYVTACILSLLSAMEWRLIAWRFPFVIEPRMVPARFIIVHCAGVLCIMYVWGWGGCEGLRTFCGRCSKHLITYFTIPFQDNINAASVYL